MMAIIDNVLAGELIAAGFKLEEVRHGKLATVYYFEDTPAIELAIDEYMSR
jgi:hypothetical protein